MSSYELSKGIHSRARRMSHDLLAKEIVVPRSRVTAEESSELSAAPTVSARSAAGCFSLALC